MHLAFLVVFSGGGEIFFYIKIELLESLKKKCKSDRQRSAKANYVNLFYRLLEWVMKVRLGSMSNTY